jgi:UDP-apiose/xylose synthase
VIHAAFTDLVPLVELCTRLQKFLVHFSTCEVYGRDYSADIPAPTMREGSTPMVFGPVSAERWSYACAKQLLERLIYAHGAHHGLGYTIVRPFNVIGPRMDYLPGIDGEGTPRVLACFVQQLLSGGPLLLVDGGKSRRSFIYVDDFVDALVRIIRRRDRCGGQIVNLGNPANDVSIRELAESMSAEYARLRGIEIGTATISSLEFYGPGYEDSERRIPDISLAEQLLDWSPKTSLAEMLPIILADYLAYYGPLWPKQR